MIRCRSFPSFLAAVLAASLLSPAPATAQIAAAADDAAAPEAMQAVTAADVRFEPIEVPGFAPGMELAVLLGDPSVPDRPYVLRARFPDGYRFPAHWHPRAENLTVISGTFLLAMGAEEADDLRAYGPGDFIYAPARMPHYGGADGETVIQLHGVGPFEIYLAGQEDAAGGR